MRANRIFVITLTILLLTGLAGATGDLFNEIQQGNIDQAKTLLEHNSAILNQRNSDGLTPINLAAYLGKADFVELLLGLGADLSIGDNDNSQPIHCSAISGDTLSIKLLLAHGADIDAKDNNSMTPFLFAISYRKVDAANYLMRRGADVNIRSNRGVTALHAALRLNQEDLVKNILDKGADPNSRDANGQTPLFLALYNDQNDIARLLIDSGAEIDDTTGTGMSLAYYAAAYRSPEIARLVFPKAKINPGETNDLGMTLLHYAAARGFTDIAEKLIDKGADLDAKCFNSKTPLYYATIWGKNEMIDLLIAKGAKPLGKEAPMFKGPYLGEGEPGRIPENFASNKLITPFRPHGRIIFSPDGKEMLWCHQAMPIQAMWHMTMRKDGTWSRPEIAPFTDPALDYADGAPAYSPDGRRIYFHALRPEVDGAPRVHNADLFYVEKSGKSWGKPQRLETTINTPNHERAPSIANSGNLYFVGEGYDDAIGAGDIYISKLVDGEFTKPVNLGATVNSEYQELTPSVAPDESYIVFASNRPTMNRQNMWLYISFKNPDGGWSGAYRLRGWFNTPPLWRTFITGDQKYLFYQEADEYKWVSTQLIEDMKRAILPNNNLSGENYDIPKFTQSDQYFEPANTFRVVLGDLDSDGDLDAVCANMQAVDSRVWLNDGHGKFTATEQRLTQQGHGVDLGDLDGDGDLDIFMVCASYGPTGIENNRASKVYLNDGKANFAETGQNLGDSLQSGNGIRLHDFDGDNDLDALVYYYQEDHVVYINDGKAHFAKSDFRFPKKAECGDLDGDGDVDLFIREEGSGYKVMGNDGHGNFVQKWSYPDSTVIFGSCTLADLDNDGDLDVIVPSGNDREGVFPTTVWYNDSKGQFEKSAIELNATKSGKISLSDLNGDGHLDAFVTNFDFPSSIWINDGKGNLLDTGMRLGGFQGNSGAALGDLDGDGDIDAFIAEFFGGSNTIWFNETR